MKNFNSYKIYSLLNNNNDSIHELAFPIIPEKWNNESLNEKWKNLFKIKQEANIAIEEKRSSKEIGSSLEADIEITTNKKQFNLLDGLDLAEYFITSSAVKSQSESNDEEIKILVKKSTGTKCPRCWKILKAKCARCESAIKEN